MFGFGVVGQGLYHNLQNSTGYTTTFKKIVVKDQDKKRSAPAHLFSYDKNNILDDENINVVVELIDDATEAFAIVKKAMEKGKHVVTANKKMVALHLAELLELQEQNNVAFLYEASSCGSIPVLRTLEEYFDNEPLQKVSGIFNGTSNYILTKTLKDGISYNEALREAQENGFAETDPTSDVEGYDIMYKTIIIALQSFGVIISPEEIVRLGITNIKPADLDYATQNKTVIKLVANIEVLPGNLINAYVLPRFVPEHSLLANVNNEFNAVIINGEFSGEQFFSGRGAGSLPTGAAVLSDLSALTYDYRYSYKKHRQKKYKGFSNDHNIKVFVSSSSRTALLNFSFISENIFEKSPGDYCLTGKVNLAALHKLLGEEMNKEVFVGVLE